ncbi:hypothetical protein CPB86DRAFT_537750 [Serendipita vermifera]|nr:hypothetical protein CPB86DRAFT_537750 [Serendipita vermifera]
MPATHHTLTHACAECKRLKLKCDKQLPCGACVRRGCSSICPDGQLVAGRGTRFILSNTKELHEEITALQARIQELESALAELQSQLTPEPHPLLQQSLKVVSESLKPEKEAPKDITPEEEDLIDTFGSLTIDPKGETIWYGPHAGSEFLIPRKDTVPTTETVPELPVDIVLLSKQFPFKNIHEAEGAIRKLVRDSLPSQGAAYKALYEYHSRLSWSTTPDLWDDFRQDILEPIYGPENTANDQQVAICFITLAVAVLMDHNRPMHHPDAKRYYHLSRASISLGEDLFQSRSLYGIQYLQTLTLYNGMTNDPNGTNRAWVTLSLAIRLAQMAGLHRDNEQWDKYPEQAARRRRMWWEMMTFETIHGFAMGRPRAIHRPYFDTKMPKDDEDEGKPPTFNRVKYRWIVEGLGSILDEAFAVKPPSYATILKLDKNIRDWQLDSVPPAEDLSKNPNLDPSNRFMVLLMRSLATTGMREIALMYLHRRYFVEALTRRPDEPLRSKFAMSVLAVHRSAVLLLQGIQRLDRLVGHLLPRIFFMWLNGLSAYVCLCAIVIKSPGCSLARSCLVEIDRTKDLFARVTAYRVSHAQPVIVTLYEQAHLAMALHREGKWPPTETHASCGAGAVDVMRFAGRPDFVSTISRKETGNSTPETHSGGSPPNNAHPMLFEYLKQFENRADKDDGTSSTYSAQTPSVGFAPDQSMLPPIIPGLDADVDPFRPPNPDGLFLNGQLNGLDFSALPSLAEQTFTPMGWPELDTMYYNQTGFPGGIQGFPSNVATLPFLPGNSYPAQSAGAFPVNGQQPQDPMWEQFVNGLVPNETLGELAPTK